MYSSTFGAPVEFEEYKQSYVAEVEQSIDFAGQSHDFFIRVKADELVASCARQLGSLKERSILDVGCGVGLMSGYVGDHFGQLHGIDIAPGVVDRASAQVPQGQFELYDGEEIPFEDETFDVAFTVCVLHHVPPSQWESLVAEMARVLKPGGLLYIFEHNPYNPLTRRAVSNCPFDADATLLTRGRSNALLRSAGLDAAEERYVLFFPWEGSGFRTIESGLRWLPLGAQYFVSGRRVR
ncbi:MAG: class I SAM-dependent methyltransferase [Myxococcales bacterium]|nr:class I SAM-dependent methyltransferase [Myxococcales bacterium]